MKKIYNFLLMLTVCLCSMGTANAARLDVDLSALPATSENTTWSWDSESQSGVFAWLQTYYNSTQLFGAGDYSDYTVLHLETIAGTSDAFRIIVRFTNGSGQVIKVVSVGSLDLTWEDLGVNATDVPYIESIRLSGKNDGVGDINVKAVYLEKPVKMVQQEVDLSALPATMENTTWSWDDESKTGVFAWSAPSWNSTELFGAGDYSAFTTLHLETTAGSMDHFRLIIKYSNGTGQTTYLCNVGTLDIAWEDMGVSSANLPYISTIRLSGANDGTGDINVKKVYLEGPEMNYIEAYRIYDTPAGAVDLKNLTGTNANWSSSVEYPKELAVQGAAFGDGDGSNQATHVSIEDYDYLSFVVTKASDNSAALRVWIWDDVNNKVVTLYLYPESQYASVENWESENRITGPGVYVVKVSGYKYLKGVKAANNWGAPSVTVGLAYASKGEKPVSFPETHKYMLIGSDPGSVSLTTALADADAVLMDASNVKAKSLELTSANPNCIFVAKEGVLGNASNVAVDGVIANMVVTDGYPMEVPASTSATAASYSRTMANQYGTICLPFAVESNDAVKFYTLGEISGDVLTINEAATLPAGTPGIVEKVSGDAITCKGTGALSNPVDVDGALKFYGSFEKKTIAAADYTGNIYAISNNKFVQAENQINLPAFRAFFAAESGEAKLRIAPNEDVTAINSLASEAASRVVGVYGVDGAQRNSLQKGMNVVKMSNGSVRKVYVK